MNCTEKVRYDLTFEQWTEYKRRAGEYALKFLQSRKLNFAEPTERDMAPLDAALFRGQARARLEMLRQLVRAR